MPLRPDCDRPQRPAVPENRTSSALMVARRSEATLGWNRSHSMADPKTRIVSICPPESPAARRIHVGSELLNAPEAVAGIGHSSGTGRLQT